MRIYIMFAPTRSLIDVTAYQSAPTLTCGNHMIDPAAALTALTIKLLTQETLVVANPKKDTVPSSQPA
jgi:hypothetical protein